MFTNPLEVILGLATLQILHPVLASPLETPNSPALDKRLTSPICQPGGSTILAAENLINGIPVGVDFIIPAMEAVFNTGGGGSIGTNCATCDKGGLVLASGTLVEYWRTIFNECENTGTNSIAGFQGLNEDLNFYAWINVA